MKYEGVRRLRSGCHARPREQPTTENVIIIAMRRGGGAILRACRCKEGANLPCLLRRMSAGGGALGGVPFQRSGVRDRRSHTTSYAAWPAPQE
jgi:hypothetical protein